VIAPGIQIVDVEPDGFGVLCSLASRYDKPTNGELHVLHDKGRVLRVVHTLRGPLPIRPVLDDLAKAAVSLRREHGVDRVVLVDRDLLVAQSHAFAAVGPGDVDQPTALRRSNELFWSSPAVVTDPAPPSGAASWERLEQHLRSLGEDYQGLLAGYDGDRCAFTLLARFVAGRIVHLTSLADRDPLDVATELPLSLVASLEVLRAIATADDLPAALTACAPQALISRGLPQ